jgi:hypothetical protein
MANRFENTPQGEAFIASAMARETDPKIMEAIAFFACNLSEAESLWNGDGFGVICHLSDFWEHVTDNGLTAPEDYAWGVEGAAWWRAISKEESA